MFRFINRLILIISLIMLVLGAFYAIGNQRSYQDSTLSSIIYADMLLSLVQAILISYALILMIITIIKTKKFKPLLCLIHYVCAFIVTALSLALSSVLNYIQ